MKTFALTALFSAIAFTALHSHPGARAQKSHCDDDPGMEGCSNEASPSSSSSKDGDYATPPRTWTVLKSIVYDEPTALDVTKDLTLVSDNTIDGTNIHFIVREGVTLTFRAPAVKLARDEASSWPLFELSGTVAFEATGSVPPLLDGSLGDEDGIVQMDHADGVFMSGPEDIVRYHASGMTVSRMEDTGDLGGPHHDQVELSPYLKASLAAYHAKLNAKNQVPSSTFPSSSSSPSTTTSSPASSSSSTSEAIDNDVESDVCVVIPYFDTPVGLDSCPIPALNPADTATTTTSAGDADDEIHATTASAGSNRDTSTNTNWRSGSDSNNDSNSTEHQHDRDHDAGGNNEDTGAEQPEQTTSNTAPPDPAAGEVNPPGSSPKNVLTVGEKLAEPLVSPTGNSAVWVADHGSIVFAQEFAASMDASGHEVPGGFRTSTLVAADVRVLKRVDQVRETLLEETREGGWLGRTIKKRSVWGWVPFRSQHQKDVERARGHIGEVEMTLTDRGCVEGSVDGICVSSRSGPYKREWMNRFPWRRRKNNDYQLHVQDDGMEVRLGEKVVWGVTADEMMG